MHYIIPHFFAFCNTFIQNTLYFRKCFLSVFLKVNARFRQTARAFQQHAVRFFFLKSKNFSASDRFMTVKLYERQRKEAEGRQLRPSASLYLFEFSGNFCKIQMYTGALKHLCTGILKCFSVNWSADRPFPSVPLDRHRFPDSCCRRIPPPSPTHSRPNRVSASP